MKHYREHFLASLCQRKKLRHVVELGVFKGRTFLHLLAHCPNLKVTGVDRWIHRPRNHGIEGAETYAKWNMTGIEKHVRACARPFGERAEILKMDTVEASERFADDSIDLVFIDADHSEAGVARDIDAWTPKVRNSGYITGHDIDWPTVRRVVEQRFPAYETGPDNVWWIRK